MLHYMKKLGKHMVGGIVFHKHHFLVIYLSIHIAAIVEKHCMGYLISHFVGFGAQQSGTIVKFNPPAGQDTMVKNGVTHNINTKHQCITAMKEYESKCLEVSQFVFCIKLQV